MKQNSAGPDRVRAALWIGLGLAFGLGVGAAKGANAAAEYYAAYFLEKSLSVDNIFVFAIVFSELRIPVDYQRRVLRFGIAAALIFRAVMILAGIALIERFDWVMHLFAALILFAAWRLAFAEEREREIIEGACDVCGTWLARLIRVTPVMHGRRFWRCEGGRRVATPLFVALVVIETTDLVFALDSVPAVLSITRDPLIVYSSNVMAMLGLRSLYFVLADGLARLHYLRAGLAIVLVFTGMKMLASGWIHVSAEISLLVIGGVMVPATLASVLRGNRMPERRLI
jgi:tellurite resistance protein TerC